MNKLYDRLKTDGDCHIWQGATTDGYGRIRVKDKMMLAHRLAFELHHDRPIRDGMLIIHSCHNRACCNPDHLREGTHQDNMTDMVSAGRSLTGIQRGGRIKMTPDKVSELRAMRDAGATYRQLREHFSISQGCVNQIVTQKTWKAI
jgi:hypothetical protein